MISTDNEVRSSKVLPNDSVPDSLTRTSHPHGKWKQGEVRHSIRVLRHDRFIDTNSCVMIDVSRFRETHDRMNENVDLSLSSSPNG